MPWSTTRGGTGTAAKYRTAEHQRRRKALVLQLKRDGFLWCTATECLFDTRAIVNPNGRERDGLHLGHEDNGVDYRGPQHNLCNVRDGAKRGNARSQGRRDPEPRRLSL